MPADVAKDTHAMLKQSAATAVSNRDFTVFSVGLLRLILDPGSLSWYDQFHEVFRHIREGCEAEDRLSQTGGTVKELRPLRGFLQQPKNWCGAASEPAESRRQILSC